MDFEAFIEFLKDQSYEDLKYAKDLIENEIYKKAQNTKPNEKELEEYRKNMLLGIKMYRERTHTSLIDAVAIFKKLG